MAKKPHIGDLVDGLEMGTRLVKEGMANMMDEFEELRDRMEITNAAAIYDMADRANEYLILLVTVLVVVKDGRAGE